MTAVLTAGDEDRLPPTCPVAGHRAAGASSPRPTRCSWFGHDDTPITLHVAHPLYGAARPAHLNVLGFRRMPQAEVRVLGVARTQAGALLNLAQLHRLAPRP